MAGPGLGRGTDAAVAADGGRRMRRRLPGWTPIPAIAAGTSCTPPPPRMPQTAHSFMPEPAGTSPRRSARQRRGGRPGACACRTRKVSFVDGLQGEVRENLARSAEISSSAGRTACTPYQLAVVVDDAAGGVTEIVRGADLLRSTPRQLWLQETQLVCAPDGRRLSKREHDLDLGVLRQTLTAGQLLGKLAFLAGLLDRPEAASAAELTRNSTGRTFLPKIFCKFGIFPPVVGFANKRTLC